MSQTSVLTTSLHIQAVEDNPGTISRAESPSEEALQDQDDDEYLTTNGQPTGQEININPRWWPEHEHRRVPLHQRAVTHPHWYAIGGDTAAIRWFMWTMFCGCQIIQVSQAKHLYSCHTFDTTAARLLHPTISWVPQILQDAVQDCQ
jgi:hypothetical protein